MVDWAYWLARAQFWVGYEAELKTAAIYTVGIALYGLVIWRIYATIATRRPFGRPDPKPGFWAAIGRGLRFLLLLPTASFLYFLVLAGALFFLAKNQTVGDILLVSVSLVGGIRLAAWINEDVARDLAKMVPLGLLGVLIVDPGYLSLAAAKARFLETPAHAAVLARYFLVLLLIETLARPILALSDRRRQRTLPVTAPGAGARAADPPRP